MLNLQMSGAIVSGTTAVAPPGTRPRTALPCARVEMLPTLIALVAALVVTPPILRHLSDEGFARENWRGVPVPFPAGIAIVAAVVVALVPAVVLDQAFEDPIAWQGAETTDVLVYGTSMIACYLLGVALLGLIDDGLAGSSRGWRGHGRALLRGQFNTGVLKAVGALGLALLALGEFGFADGELALAVALLVLTTNLFNLLDLRPGRAAKTFSLLIAGLMIGAWNLEVVEALGPFAAPVLVVGFYDLRERAMLGDTGANLIGGLAGLWMVLSFDTTGQAIALAVVFAITVYGEFRSISAFVERTPLLRQIDSIGRNDAHA
jgi:UDP-GlcNAc:undecaprenyl-phosphate/decaprenyl-phosphate GlcNAc-1-phosphate transferase